MGTLITKYVAREMAIQGNKPMRPVSTQLLGLRKLKRNVPIYTRRCWERRS